MNEKIKRRVLEEANIIKNTKITLRELSRLIGVSKSTIHNDMKERLKLIDKSLFIDVNKIFSEHKNIRHYLGGLATKKKYKKNNIK